MQLYRGLPIITNKIPLDEQKGIPHHLLSTIPLDSMPWDVTEFKEKATALIQEIRGRGRLPILVGGTHYYVDSLLFQDTLLDDVQNDDSKSFPILEESTEVLLSELRKVDPVMAERWHPNDRRKIRRSLEIYLQTGRPASEHYAEQEQRKAASSQKDNVVAGDNWENLLFWVFSERQVLCDRLDKRVDKMLNAGLLDEIRELSAYKRQKAENGDVLDMTKGIWQSIGFKQLEQFACDTSMTNASPEETPTLLAALEDMKTATRRYANYQTRWIRMKQIQRLKDRGIEAINSLYLLNSTDVSQFATNVVEPATDLVTKFLTGQEKPLPAELSTTASEVLTKVTEPVAKQTVKQRTCESCQTVLVTEEAWERHVKSAGHKRVLKRKKRLALVPVPEGEASVGEASEGKEDDISLGDIFER